MLGILIGITAVVLTVGHRRGREGQGPGPDQRARHEHPRGLARQLDEHAPAPRGGFGSASTLTVQDAAGARSRSRSPPTSQAVAPASTSSVSLVYGSTNWTTTLTGTTPSVADDPVARRQQPAGSSTPTDESTRQLGRRPRPRHRDASCSAAANPIGQSVTYNGVKLEVIGVLDALSSSDDDLEQRPRDRPAQHLLAAPRRRHEPQLGELDLRQGDVGVARSRPRTRRPTRSCSNAHKITTAANADFSIATQQSILQRGELGRRHADGHARRHRGHLAARRRHRRDEHHAGLGHRADPRDRRAQGHRRAARVDPPPVPRRGRRPRPRRRHARRRASACSAPSSSPLSPTRA